MKNYELIWQALSGVEYGSLKIFLSNGEEKFFAGKNSGPNADIKIFDDSLIDLVISGGDVAFGESHMENLWDSSNLADLLTFLTLNSHALEEFFHARKFKALILFIKSFFTKNTKRGSKKNIRAHYDLGNDFYKLWIDETMTYSSALFADKDISLALAQKQKYRNILSKFNSGNVLEIGCGWGGFAEEAAKDGRNITCLTISPRQREYALTRLEKAGLSGLSKVKLQDYRNENGIYDNVASIEMFEAVGKEYWDKYFEVVCDVLKQGGKAVLQIITI
ncbi:MAG: class I SAM-dependent methyltransferase, partial [Alphaproteobacteria bacterium]|nr:class I SAM-dependent methyltransferase [Alphaproteobacteria bacterium]